MNANSGPFEGTAETTQEFAQRERRELRHRQSMDSVANELNLHYEFRTMRGDETPELSRIATYSHDDLLLDGKSIYVCDSKGFWHNVDSNIKLAHRYLPEIMLASDKVALQDFVARYPDEPEYADKLAKSFTYGVAKIRNMYDAINRLAGPEFYVRPVRYWHRQLDNPILPLSNGECLSLITMQRFTPEELRALCYIQPEWAINSDWIAYPHAEWPRHPDVDWFIQHIGEDLFKRVAGSLLGVARDLMAVKVKESGAGKSMAFDLMSEATNDAIHREEDSTEYSEAKGDRFSAGSVLLTKHLVVAYDEVDKSGPMKAKTLNRLTNPGLGIELKRENRIRIPRTGSIYFVGADWPEVDISEQGVKERFSWCYESTAPAIDRKYYAQIVHNEDCKIDMLNRLLMWAHGQVDDRYKIGQGVPPNPNHLDAFREKTTPAEVKTLTTHIAVAQQNPDSCFMSNAQLTEILQNDGLDAPKTNAMGSLVNRAFKGRATAGMKTLNGKKVRGYYGIKVRQ